MPVNATDLNAALAALETQVAATEGVEDSAVALIQGFAQQITAAVTKALEDDNKADQTTIDAANAAIASVTARFSASGGKLGAAVANVPQ